MKVYELILKNEKVQSYKASLPLITGLNCIAFLFLGLNYTISFKKSISLGTAVLLAVLLAAHFFLKPKQNPIRFVSVFIIIAAYSLLQLYLFAICIAAIFILYEITTRKLVVGVTQHHITYPSFPAKTIEWKELENCILKDGLLTIDLKNNKILQGEISGSIDEKEFNDFCRTQLQK